MSRIDETVRVNLPAEDCYKHILHFENYRRFLPAVREIRRKGDPDVWRWVIDTAEGELSWDMELDGARHQNHIVSWHTVRESDIPHSGALTLKGNGSATDIHLVVEYTTRTDSEPVRVGERVGTAVRKGLESLKQYLEKGAQVQGMTGATAAGQSRNPETLDKM